MTTLLLHLNWPLVSFLVSTRLHLMLKTEKGEAISNDKKRYERLDMIYMQDDQVGLPSGYSYNWVLTRKKKQR